MADPGFPVGGGTDSQGGYVSKILLYVETKESGPLWGRARARPPPPQIRQCSLFEFLLMSYVAHCDNLFHN